MKLCANKFASRKKSTKVDKNRLPSTLVDFFRLLSILLLLPAAHAAVDGTWVKHTTAPRNYSDILNWSPDIARGAGATATFNPRSSYATFQILLDESPTLGQLLFTANGGARIFNSNAVHTITFDNGRENSRVTIPCERASVHIDVPLILANNTTLAVSKSVTITRANETRFTQPVTGRGDISVSMSGVSPKDENRCVLRFEAPIHISGGIAMQGTPTQFTRAEYLVLAAANTYPGGTRVFSGILNARAPGSLGTGDIVVGAFGELRLDASAATHPRASLALFSATHDGRPARARVNLGPTPATTNTVATLLVNGARQPPGFYTAPSHEATQPFFAGLGVLKVEK